MPEVLAGAVAHVDMAMCVHVCFVAICVAVSRSGYELCGC